LLRSYQFVRSTLGPITSNVTQLLYGEGSRIAAGAEAISADAVGVGKALKEIEWTKVVARLRYRMATFLMPDRNPWDEEVVQVCRTVVSVAGLRHEVCESVDKHQSE